MAVKDTTEKLDEAADMALDWAIDILGIKIKPADPSYLKIQALKAQASALVGQLKARVDPSGMRGKRGDRVGELLAQRIKEAKAKPN
jgi:hypothetical protein